MKKSILILLGLAVIIIILLVFLFLPESDQAIVDNNEPPMGIEVFSPKENETVSSPLKISGMIKGNGWTAFEGQTGIVRLFDNSDKELALGILTATEDWMQTNVNFETTLWFDYPGDGEGKLIFYNENASGEPERNRTFELPIKLQKSSSANTKVKVYFSQSGDVVDCSTVFPAERQVSQTQSVARVALEELLKGPTDLEKYAGLVSNINDGVKIQSLTIKNGVAKVDFNDALDEGVAGSCKVLAIKAQITETLKQFPTVTDVVISINGKIEDILQP